MPIIDQTLTYKTIEPTLAETTNPRHRLMLERLLQHARCEVEEDLEGVMATLSPNPAYRVRSGGPEMNPVGAEAVRRFYVEQIYGKGRYCLESNKERILVSDDAIVTEAMVRSVHWGRDLIDMGAPVDDPDGVYLMTWDSLIVWPYDEDARIIGEEGWSMRVGPDAIRRITEDELPETFKRYVAGRRRERAAA
jgi:hypothetical protein